MPAAGACLKTGLHLRRAVVLPGPMPGDRREIDAADDRPRALRAVGDRAGKVERVVGDEHGVIVAVERG